MEYFVDKNSIVRTIWGKSDTILLIFAGASAEFALSKAVDWLYFTGRLPGDPIGRLFSTVSYAQQIAFSEKQFALRSIETINAIHSSIETKRGDQIPHWAYRDVISMLIDYSIRSFELLNRDLTLIEKHEVFNVFNRIGNAMNIQGLPGTFEEWETSRVQSLNNNIEYSKYTKDLFRQYRKHLGFVNYRILVESQKMLLPTVVRKMLGFRSISMLSPIAKCYKLGTALKLDRLFKKLFLPSKYRRDIAALDVNPVKEGRLMLKIQ